MPRTQRQLAAVPDTPVLPPSTGTPDLSIIAPSGVAPVTIVDAVSEGLYPSRCAHDTAVKVLEMLPTLASLDSELAVKRLGVYIDQESGLRASCEAVNGFFENISKHLGQPRAEPLNIDKHTAFRVPLQGGGEVALLVNGDINSQELADAIVEAIRSSFSLRLFRLNIETEESA